MNIRHVISLNILWHKLYMSVKISLSP